MARREKPLLLIEVLSMSDLGKHLSDQHVPSLTAADEPAVRADAQAVPAGAGELLKRAREAAGLHIAALAVSLKVPVKKLEALESDRLDLLPDAVFVRALASSVCRTLKIDPAAILARLPQTDVPKLMYQGTSIDTPFRSSGDRSRPSIWPHFSQPAVLAGMLLLLGALVLVFLPNIKMAFNHFRPELTDAQAKSMAIENLTPAPAAVKAPPIPLATSSNQVVPSAPAFPMATTRAPAVAQSSVNMALPSPLLTPAPKVSIAGGSSVTSTAAANIPAANSVVVFTAKTESWVEATDAKGQVVLRRTLAAGEVVGASGALPLKVIVGRVNATQVEIRGKVFDMNAVAKDNVARFEVN
jgi:cytoskeleton protein RodZ